jgi:replicative DNA helicase
MDHEWNDLMADGEFSILSEILTGRVLFHEVVRTVRVIDFAEDRHQCIYQNMLDLYRRGEVVNRVTVANELMKNGALESIGGLSYLVSMSPDEIEGGPTEEELLEGMRDAAEAVRDQDVRQRIVLAAQRLMDRALLSTVEDDPMPISKKKLEEVAVADGLLAIANSLNAVAKAIRELGLNNAGTPMGAIELLAKEVRDGFQSLSLNSE